MAEDNNKSMNARVKWVENMSFVGQSGSGHSMVMDGSPEHGGGNLGVRPMEAVLLGLGGCSAFDVVSILKKLRQTIDDCFVEIRAERSEGVPSVFTKIHLHFVAVGKGVAANHLERAVSLSMDKYCSVSEMLRPKVEITHSHELMAASPQDDLEKTPVDR